MYANDGTLQWVQTYSGPARQRDVAMAMALDDRDNLIVAGGSMSNGYNDYVTLKYATDSNCGGYIDDPARKQRLGMEMQRLVYSVKNPVPQELQGRFNLGPPVSSRSFGDPHAFVALEVKPSGQVVYMAADAFGEKVTGSTFWGDAKRADVFSFIKKKAPASHRSLAGRVSMTTASSTMSMPMQCAWMAYDAERGDYLHSRWNSLINIQGARYVPRVVPYFFQSETIPRTLSVTALSADSVIVVDSSWGVTSKGVLQPLVRIPKESLKFDRKTGLWTGALKVYTDAAPVPFMALSCNDYAAGSWLRPVKNRDPLNDELGAVWLVERLEP